MTRSFGALATSHVDMHSWPTPLNFQQRLNATDRAKSPVNPQFPGSSPDRGGKEFRSPKIVVYLLFRFDQIPLLMHRF